MSVYAPVPAFVDGKRHPRALILIVAAHAAALAAVMMTKSDIVRPIFRPTTVTLIPDQKPPPENPPPPQPEQHRSAIDHPTSVVPIPQPTIDLIPVPKIDPVPAIDPRPPVNIAPPAEPVRTGPRFLTPASDVKPPYPQSKLRLAEETVLRLKLSIDEHGRVTAVDPVGAADPVFLAAARRHLIVHWRYRPATEDGRAVATSTVITLRFQLDQ